LKPVPGNSVTAGGLDRRTKGGTTPLFELNLVSIAQAHTCAKHELFAELRRIKMTAAKAAALLRNYDAHASVLRRLLLKAASIMPEAAVGFVLENVRTEYGAGNIEDRHQLQLIDLATKCGASRSAFDQAPIQPGVKNFIKAVTPFYYPINKHAFSRAHKAAVAAGAITATEILAIEEFKAMQVAFAQFGLENHIWFDHVSVEVDHTSEALALAHHFMFEYGQTESVLAGLNGVLTANVSLYDGLLAALLVSGNDKQHD
jgi:Iron-containing redox enzyme